MIANAGFEVAFRGEYHEIVPDERIVSADVFEPMPDAAASTTTTFEEKDARTKVSILVQHQNREDRDAHIASGMEDGLQEALNYLEQVAPSLS